MYDEILEFIRRRFPEDSNWCTGNCYWFAAILHMRFPQYQIWYFPIENHFMIGDGKNFYDWQGLRLLENCEENPILWANIEQMDKTYYNHLVRDCVK